MGSDDAGERKRRRAQERKRHRLAWQSTRVQMSKLRHQRGLTQEQVANASARDRVFYNLVENDKCTAELDWFCDIARGFGVELRDLFPLPIRDVSPRLISARQHIDAAPANAGDAPSDHGVHNDERVVDFAQEETAPPPEIAARLGLAVGEPALRRAFTICRDKPVEAAESWIACRRITDADAMQALRQAPSPGGTGAELASAGMRVTRLAVRVRGRRVTDPEADRLYIPYGSPILAVTWLTIANSDIIEAAEHVYPLLDTELKYPIDIPAPDSGDRDEPAAGEAGSEVDQG